MSIGARRRKQRRAAGPAAVRARLARLLVLERQDIRPPAEHAELAELRAWIEAA